MRARQACEGVHRTWRGEGDVPIAHPLGQLRAARVGALVRVRVRIWVRVRIKVMVRVRVRF